MYVQVEQVLKNQLHDRNKTSNKNLLLTTI